MGEYLGIVVLIIFGVVVVFMLGMFAGRKNSGGLHSNMMSNIMEQQQKMLEGNSDKLEGMMSTMIKTRKKILDENADDLDYMNKKEAEIESAGVRIKAKAVKEGLTGVESNTAFCKHCGASIDADSNFCKSCGKEQ